MDTFDGFLDRIGDASGQRGLVEAVRRGYRVLTEGTGGNEAMFPEVPGWTHDGAFHTTYYHSCRYTRSLPCIHGNIVATAAYNSARNIYEICSVSIHTMAPGISHLLTSDIKVIDISSLKNVGGRDGIASALDLIYGKVSEINPLQFLRELFEESMHGRSYDTVGEAYRMLKDHEYYDDDDDEPTLLDDIGSSDSPVVNTLLERLFGEDYYNRPLTDLLTVSPEKIFLVGAKESGYNLDCMVNELGAELVRWDSRDYVFDEMAKEVMLDPVRYADDEHCLFMDYARAVVNGDI